MVSAFLAVGIAYGVYWGKVLRYSQSTDDAYVNGNVVQITPQISGTVVSIGADDTQFVKAGQPLVRLDKADAKVALDQAEAQLARTVREVRNLFATTAQLQATVDVRRTDLAAAQSDLARRAQLGRSGAVSGEELQHAQDAVKAAESGLLAAQQQLVANRARIDHTTLEDHPDVRNAAAAVRNAYLTYARTVLPAPVSGFVARRNVQLGQRVSPGAALMAVVDRIEHQAGGQETPIGVVPTADDLDLDGLDVDASDVNRALAVNAAEWRQELPLIEEWFEFVGDKLPTGVRDEFEALKQRLAESD